MQWTDGAYNVYVLLYLEACRKFDFLDSVVSLAVEKRGAAEIYSADNYPALILPQYFPD
jgi:hypothetical protein